YRYDLRRVDYAGRGLVGDLRLPPSGRAGAHHYGRRLIRGPPGFSPLITTAAVRDTAMKLFECQNCGQPLYFENTKCESWGLRLGYLPKQEGVNALGAAGGGGRRGCGVRSRRRGSAIAPAPTPSTTSATGSCLPRIMKFFVRPAATTAPSPISQIPRISCIGARSNTPSIGSFIRCCGCGCRWRPDRKIPTVLHSISCRTLLVACRARRRS